ncbi:MAG: glycosyltransferase family 2 protein [Lentimicrobiaceae bacterium]|nr:glycosyltransferase family 2 protein [Lentimicrobiaceae bacterium]
MEIKLSVVIVTFNEEHNLGRCLASVRAVADEVIVLDSFSTDQTADICTTFGARFYQHPFDELIEQKNRALAYTSYPYVLSLNADEALDDTLIASIQHVKQNWQRDAYTMNCVTNYCGKWIYYSGWYPNRKLRLWDKRKGQWVGTGPEGKVKMHDANYTPMHLTGNLLHFSYTTPDEHQRHVAYFNTILAQTQFENGKRVNIFTMYAYPVIKFLYNYILNLGILDGKAGFNISRTTARAAFIRQWKIRSLQSRKIPES